MIPFIKTSPFYRFPEFINHVAWCFPTIVLNGKKKAAPSRHGFLYDENNDYFQTPYKVNCNDDVVISKEFSFQC